MRIVLNGQSIETTSVTLADLVAEHNFDAPSVATALNATFVPRALRAETDLHDGARVEIVAPMQGG